MPTITQKTLPTREVQDALPLEVSARTIFVDAGFVRIKRGVDNESVLAMANNARHPKHLRFVFDLSCGDGIVCEYRFWAREVLAEGQNGFTSISIEAALKEILGERAFFRRGDFVVQWVVTRKQISKFIQCGDLNETGNRIMRGSAEKFLRKRWIGNGGKP